jgi:hypothetical protein
MASEKACYWLAVGILLLGLNGRFANLKETGAHRFFEQPAQWAEQVSRGLVVRAQIAALESRKPPVQMAVVVRAPERARCANAAVERRNLDLARVNAATARLQARLARIHAEGMWR